MVPLKSSFSFLNFSVLEEKLLLKVVILFTSNSPPKHFLTSSVHDFAFSI